MNLEVKDRVGRKYIHREFKFTVPEIAEAFAQGFADDRYLQYTFSGDGYMQSYWKQQLDDGTVELTMKITFDVKTGGFSFRLGKPANNLERLVALGRGDK